MANDILSIVKRFKIQGEPAAFERTGSGHINDSYRILMKESGGPGYLLQRINHAIFRDVPGLTANILAVTRHIGDKIRQGSSALPFSGLDLIQTQRGEFFHKDDDGNFWRLYNFIEGSRSYDLVPGPSLAYEGGRAFGVFLGLTSDLDATTLMETIPDFHNIETRLAAFRKFCTQNPSGRSESASKEIEFAERRADEMHLIRKLGAGGEIPVRVTHNDTKFNNILFDSRDRAICIVDLDTVMPGYVLYDFGDAIRTGANTGEEDEADLSKVGISLELFEAYSRGFLETALPFLTRAEKAHLAFSARYMTFLIGLRFLTDHIAGDTYYKIKFPGHNLQRAKAQFRLVRSMEENSLAMEKIISDLCT
jgi:hypothetical protein